MSLRGASGLQPRVGLAAPVAGDARRAFSTVGALSRSATRRRARGTATVASQLDPRDIRASAIRDPQAQGSDASLGEMQRLLLKQIEERKRLHAALLERLKVEDTPSPPPPPPPRPVAPMPPPPRPVARAAPPPPAAPPPVAKPPPRPVAPPPKRAPEVVPVPVPVARPVRPPTRPEAPRAPSIPQYNTAPPQPAAPAPPPEPELPPALCKERLNVVMVAMECAPWAKTGGLGDVASALPKALARRGHRVMCVTPRYANYEGPVNTNTRIKLRALGQDTECSYYHQYIDGVDFVFVDHQSFHHHNNRIYAGDRSELFFRCALLSQAAIEAVWIVPCGGVPYGDENLAYVANDWHTALLPVMLQAFYRDHGKLTYARCTMVIHNMAHQGRAPLKEYNDFGIPDKYKENFFLDDPFGGVCMNIMKAGLITAHKLVAVSHGYAWETKTDMGGWGLAPVMNENASKLSGIVNGIDTVEWNPEIDPHLRSDGYANFTPDANGLLNKARCKEALQRQLGLPVRPDVPLVGFIGRLDHQKGVDLINDSQGWLMSQDLQLVMLGSGSPELEQALRTMENNNKEKCRGWVGFSVQMSHRITAGCDILLMPSRFEPCGLNQLYAMRYGTVPVVHSVGGLRDTVKPFNPFENTGTGWTFPSASANELQGAMGNAITTYRQYPDAFRGLQLRAMAQDLSWDVAAQQYEDVLIQAKYTW